MNTTKKETPDPMSIFTRKAEAAARAEKAAAAAEKARTELEAIEAEEQRKRRARLAEYDRAQVEEWDADRVRDELAEAQARLTQAALDTPFFAALIDLHDLQRKVTAEERVVRQAAERLGIDADASNYTQGVGSGFHLEGTMLSIVQAETARRAEQRQAAATAARQAYADDLD